MDAATAAFVVGGDVVVDNDVSLLGIGSALTADSSIASSSKCIRLLAVDWAFVPFSKATLPLVATTLTTSIAFEAMAAELGTAAEEDAVVVVGDVDVAEQVD